MCCNKLHHSVARCPCLGRPKPGAQRTCLSPALHTFLFGVSSFNQISLFSVALCSFAHFLFLSRFPFALLLPTPSPLGLRVGRRCGESEDSFANSLRPRQERREQQAAFCAAHCLLILAQHGVFQCDSVPSGEMWLSSDSPSPSLNL